MKKKMKMNMNNVAIKKRELEIILQKLPPNTAPIIRFEQYTTPANIASDILFNAYQAGDISEKVIVDSGCGTGIFAIGAKLLGARKVIGIDIDGNGLTIAKTYANALGLKLKFIEKDIKKLDFYEIHKGKIDTIIQNPPFGAQKAARGIDRIFLEKALDAANITYSLHLTKTEKFIELLIDKLNGTVEWKKEYSFPIGYQFFFHKDRSKEFSVTIFKIRKKYYGSSTGMTAPLDRLC